MLLAHEKKVMTVITRIPYGRKRHERFTLYTADWHNSSRPILIILAGMWYGSREKAVYNEISRAFVEDGFCVALVEVNRENATETGFLSDIQHAVPTVVREALPLGGDPMRLVLWGDGIGTFAIAQTLFNGLHDRWTSASICRLLSWIAIDGIWDRALLSQLPHRHPLRDIHNLPLASSGDGFLSIPPRNYPRGMLIQLNAANSHDALSVAEGFAREFLSLGTDITLIPRNEAGDRIWRGIQKPEHPLRITLRQWLYHIIHS